MIRKIARPALASVYIADGVDTLLNVDEHVDESEAFASTSRSVLPSAIGGSIPQDGATMARIIGGTKVGAGSLLAFGKFPRVSAAVLAVSTIPSLVGRNNFWAESDSDAQKNKRNGFLTNVALLGGLAITSADTDGKPSLKYRADKALENTNKKVAKALPGKSDTEKLADNAKDWINDTAHKAQDYVNDNKDDWIKQAKDAKDKAQDFVNDNKDDWIETAQDGASKLTDKVSDAADRARTYANKNGDDWLKAAQKNAKTAKKSVVKAAAEAQDKADDALSDYTGLQGKLKRKKAGRKAEKKAEKLQKDADKALEKAKKKLKKKLDI